MTRGTHRAPKVGRGKSAQATSSSGSSRVVLRHRDGEHGKHFSRLEDPTAKHPRWGRDVTVIGGRDTDHGSSENLSLQEINVPPGQIKVKEEIIVTSSNWLDYKDRVY